MPKLKTSDVKRRFVPVAPVQPPPRIGDVVVALVEIAEEEDDHRVVHARPGDQGTVVGLGEWPTIRWESTVSDCVHGEEFIIVRSVDLTFGRPAVA